MGENKTNLDRDVELEELTPLRLSPDRAALRVGLGIFVLGPNRVEVVLGFLALGVVFVGEVDPLVPACLQQAGDVVEIVNRLFEDETIAGGEQLELDCFDDEWQGWCLELEEIVEKGALGQVLSLRRWRNQYRAMRRTEGWN